MRLEAGPHNRQTRVMALAAISGIAYGDGAVAELVVWRVPVPVAPTTHGFKYRLAYVVKGRRVLGYDNERSKGDLRHIEDPEEPVKFHSPEDLIERFIGEIETIRGET